MLDIFHELKIYFQDRFHKQCILTNRIFGSYTFGSNCLIRSKTITENTGLNWMVLEIIVRKESKTVFL